jgi:SAM-dependent methyltransferase
MTAINRATTPAPAEDAFKGAMRAEWDAAANGWNDWGPAIAAWLRESTDAMLDVAAIGPGARVIDVAAGAGDQTLDIARRVGPAGSVLATDLSAGILAFAAGNARRAGLANVTTRVADGESLPADAIGFDAALCRLGLMFFPQPLQGLRGMHRALRPGGRAAVLVFGGPQANPCIVALVATALKHAGLPPRDPWQPGGLLSLGKPGLTDALFAEAGFTEVETRVLAAPFRLASVDDYLGFIRASASPILQIVNRLEPAARDAAWAEIAERLHAFDTADGWEGPNELLLTAGRR